LLNVGSRSNYSTYFFFTNLIISFETAAQFDKYGEL
jgi:hypothetical protein